MSPFYSCTFNLKNEPFIISFIVKMDSHKNIYLKKRPLTKFKKSLVLELCQKLFTDLFYKFWILGKILKKNTSLDLHSVTNSITLNTETYTFFRIFQKRTLFEVLRYFNIALILNPQTFDHIFHNFLKTGYCS